MDQKALWTLLRARWIPIVLVGLLGTALAAAYTYVSPREYTAESEVFVTADQSDNASELAQGSNFSQQQARNYSVVATREIVLARVIEQLDLDMSVAALARHVSTSVPLNTSLISVEVTDESPERAAAIADSVSENLTQVVGDLVPKRSDDTSPVRLETVQSAYVPTFPTSPNVRLLIALGLLLGLAAGIALVVLREVVSAKIRLPEQVRQIAGPTVLGTLAVDKSTSVQPMLTSDDALSLRAEEYRQIRTNLRFLQTGEGHKAFAITSSIPGEGKSTTAANIAAAAAATGAKVCLVEADLRKPALGGYLDLESAVGLTTVLANEVKLDDAFQEWGENGLQVLLAGEIPPNPSELLGSRQMEQLLTTLRKRFEIVILDCPPLMPVTDAAVLGRFVKGAILVVGTGTVEVRELRNSVETLTVAGVPVLGTILNRMPVRHASRYQQPYVLPEPKKARKRRIFASASARNA